MQLFLHLKWLSFRAPNQFRNACLIVPWSPLHIKDLFKLYYEFLFFLLISPQLFLWHWNAVCILMTFKSIFSNHISTPVSRFPSNWLLDSSCSIGGHISSFASLNPPFLLSPEKLHLQNVIYTCPPLSISTTLTYAEARLLLPGPL